MEKQKLIILTGPTAVGKTALSVQLARKINAEIISADSMQIYRHMDIGTAKIKKEEMQGVRHHLIDVLDPSEDCNVFLFSKLAKAAVKDIVSRGKIPLIVGGTGFYIQAVLYDIDFSDAECAGAYRQELERIAKEEGNASLHERLKEIDPVSYETIHENNVKRVIRALEYYHDNGTPISDHNMTERQKESPYDFRYFVLTDDRKKLYDRIDRRVDEMMAQGLLEEVKQLREKGYAKDLVSMQGLGYKELLDHLDGSCDLDEAVRIIKRDTRHFAKRQMTWFRRERDVIFLNKADYAYDDRLILEKMLEYL
ncbi:MAG: tRNA (adenosine(37)-N6)-dimethylallyltransferase MiaA [Lachnospiraceae bacterium]|nr:tRNA (adenosine(37)-N6)-dimethylallyltransferase MiaA [Lachnospiraceae bacterium]